MSSIRENLCGVPCWLCCQYWECVKGLWEPLVLAIHTPHLCRAREQVQLQRSTSCVIVSPAQSTKRSNFQQSFIGFLGHPKTETRPNICAQVIDHSSRVVSRFVGQDVAMSVWILAYSSYLTYSSLLYTLSIRQNLKTFKMAKPGVISIQKRIWSRPVMNMNV